FGGVKAELELRVDRNPPNVDERVPPGRGAVDRVQLAVLGKVREAHLVVVREVVPVDHRVRDDKMPLLRVLELVPDPPALGRVPAPVRLREREMVRHVPPETFVQGVPHPARDLRVVRLAEREPAELGRLVGVGVLQVPEQNLARALGVLAVDQEGLHADVLAIEAVGIEHQFPRHALLPGRDDRVPDLVVRVAGDHALVPRVLVTDHPRPHAQRCRLAGGDRGDEHRLRGTRVDELVLRGVRLEREGNDPGALFPRFGRLEGHAGPPGGGIGGAAPPGGAPPPPPGPPAPMRAESGTIWPWGVRIPICPPGNGTYWNPGGSGGNPGGPPPGAPPPGAGIGGAAWGAGGGPAGGIAPPGATPLPFCVFWASFMPCWNASAAGPSWVPIINPCINAFTHGPSTSAPGGGPPGTGPPGAGMGPWGAPPPPSMAWGNGPGGGPPAPGGIMAMSDPHLAYPHGASFSRLRSR